MCPRNRFSAGVSGAISAGGLSPAHPSAYWMTVRYNRSLSAKLVVHRGDVRVRTAADLLDGRVAEAALGKHLARGLEQPLARIS